MIGDVADNTERFLYVYHNLYQNPPTVYRYLPSVHFEGANFAFVDGHVKWLSLQKIIDGERFYTRAED
jgi:prepilin-type processing-associated H-X9-DG protein